MAEQKNSGISGGRIGMVLGGIILAVAVVAVFTYDGFMPSESDATGAIGAAEKYRAEQITEADVLLENPELQEILQNDKIQALLSDDNFRQALTADDFRKSFGNGSIFDAISTEAFKATARSRQAMEVLQYDSFRNALVSRDSREQIVTLLADDGFKQILSPEAAATVTVESMRNYFSLYEKDAGVKLDDNFKKISIENMSFRKHVASMMKAPRAFATLKTWTETAPESMFKLMGPMSAFKAITAPASMMKFTTAYQSDDAFKAAIQNQAFLTALDNRYFRERLTKDMVSNWHRDNRATR